RINVGGGRGSRQPGQGAKPNYVPEKGGKNRQEEHGYPPIETHRLQVADEGRGSDGDQREKQGRADQQGPRHERNGRIAAEVPLPEHGVQGGEHRGRDHRERTLGGLEAKLAFRSGEEDHDPESREREGDSLNLEWSEAFPKEGGGEDRDEGGRGRPDCPRVVPWASPHSRELRIR